MIEVVTSYARPPAWVEMPPSASARATWSKPSTPNAGGVAVMMVGSIAVASGAPPPCIRNSGVRTPEALDSTASSTLRTALQRLTPHSPVPAFQGCVSEESLQTPVLAKLEQSQPGFKKLDA
ncbi:MAG TPA: hypothetical protein VLL27_08755 [Solirubrobacterales bacterium]|nr:hypothetical protein [Solirubrobacterales bacterium]